MDRFLNIIKAHAGALDVGAGQPRFGIVASVDNATATARVMLQPEGVLTGWLPILSPWVGHGWGIVCPPSPGDQVLVIPQEGNGEHGVIVGGVFSVAQTPPTAPIGELWLSHKTGSAIKLRNDGTIYIVGDLHVDGDVYDHHGSLAHLRSVYDAHTHVDSRSGATSAPSVQD